MGGTAMSEIVTSAVLVGGRSLSRPSSLTTALSATLLLASVFAADQAQAAIGLGQRGGQVKTMQATLAQLGFDPGGIDGVFGPKTLRALIQFQRGQQLQADGILGPKTAQALAIAAPTATQPELSNSLSNNLSNNRGPGLGIVATASRKGINIRQTPNGTVIGYAIDGVQLQLTGQERRASGRTWLEIATGGWVASDFVRSGTVAQSESAPAPLRPSAGGERIGLASQLKASSSRVYVKASRLNIRTSPAGQVIGVVQGSTPLALTGNYKTHDGYEWAEISSGGWVATQFLKGDR